MSARIEDPVEKVIADALDEAGIAYLREPDPATRGLDFYLPDLFTWVEAKRFHTARAQRQIARADAVIMIVGLRAARAFADMLTRRAPPG